MKYKKTLSFFCALMIMLICAFPCTAFAEDLEPPVQTDVTDENVASTGLIMSYSLSISAGTKKVLITATTTATRGASSATRDTRSARGASAPTAMVAMRSDHVL